MAALVCPVVDAAHCADGATGSCTSEDETSLLQATQLVKPGKEREPPPFLGDAVEDIVEDLVGPHYRRDSRRDAPHDPLPLASVGPEMSAYEHAKERAAIPIEDAALSRQEFAESMAVQKAEAAGIAQAGIDASKRAMAGAFKHAHAKINAAVSSRRKARSMARRQVSAAKRAWERTDIKKHRTERAAVAGGWAGRVAGEKHAIETGIAARNHEWKVRQARLRERRMMARARRIEDQRNVMAKAVARKKATEEAIAAAARQAAEQAAERMTGAADRAVDATEHQVRAMETLEREKFNQYAKWTNRDEERIAEVARR